MFGNFPFHLDGNNFELAVPAVTYDDYREMLRGLILPLILGNQQILDPVSILEALCNLAMISPQFIRFDKLPDLGDYCFLSGDVLFFPVKRSILLHPFGMALPGGGLRLVYGFAAGLASQFRQFLFFFVSQSGLGFVDQAGLE